MSAFVLMVMHIGSSFLRRSIAHLPDQRARRVFLAPTLPVATPQAIRRSQGFGLHDLCVVHVTVCASGTILDNTQLLLYLSISNACLKFSIRYNYLRVSYEILGVNLHYRPTSRRRSNPSALLWLFIVLTGMPIEWIVPLRLK